MQYVDGVIKKIVAMLPRMAPIALLVSIPHHLELHRGLIFDMVRSW